MDKMGWSGLQLLMHQVLWLPAIYVCDDKCDHNKIAKCLEKLPKNDFTRKIIDFDTFTKIA